MKKFILILAGLFLVIFLTKAQSISGTWLYQSGNLPLTLLLLDNGTGEFQGMAIKYRIQDGKLTLDDGIQPVTYNYKLTATTLTLSGGGMQMAISFSKSGSSNENIIGQSQYKDKSENSSTNINTSQNTNVNSKAGANGGLSGGTDLSGIWDGQQGKVIFYPDGTMLYNGTSYQYSASGNSIYITGNDGSVTFTYNLTNNQLTLSQNTSSARYSKTSALKPDRIDPQMVGKWCILANNYNYSSGGGSSSEECITLNADGTYDYFYSASRSAYTVDQSAYGGTANQNSDRGTWKTDGMTIVSVSQTTGKTSRYSLVKENAQNGDATIVIGGRKFITAYNRPRW